MNDIMERQNLKGGLSNFFTPSTLAATLELIQIQRSGLVAVRWGIMSGDMGKAIRELERKTDELYTQRKIDFNTMNEILDIIITIKHIIERLGP